jgi:hypothetical protein
VWNGSSWDDTEICAAGGYLYPDQPHYSGGVAIDPDDIDTVFASREINGIHTLFRYVFSGGSWTGEQITADQRAMRPYVIRNRASEPRLLYLKGDYSTYEDYETSLELIDSTTAAVSNSTDANHANVLLHLRGDDTIDRSPVARTLTFGANIIVQGSKTRTPGSTSTGGDGVITAPDAADLTFAGDFTIEIFGAVIDSPSLVHSLVSQWRIASASRSWQTAYQGNVTPSLLTIFLSSDGSASTAISGSFTPTGEHDFCFERSGNTVRVYADGAMIGSGTFSSTLKNSPSRLVIGSLESSTGTIANASAVWDGSYKEIRITKAARYASNSGYTVPSIPLPTS